MEEKLQFVPSLKDAFAIGVKNLVPIVLSVLLWLVTVWIPYVNVGTTIALATLPVKLSKGEMISPMFIFESKYRHCMGEYFILQAVIISAVYISLLFMIVPAIVLSLSWMLAVYLLVGKKMNWALCLSESNRLMMGYKFKAFCLKFAVNIALLVVSYVLFSMFDAIAGSLGVLVVLVCVLVGVCVMLSVDAVIYRELVLSEDKVEEAKPEEAL